ncbi:hypothetical protein [Paenibacillus alba]|uniref:Uncharacterized protein n=1 Tax=Paenibacillus alba TaxID=1197127 RepID=A0ABU6G0T6_9BACL|nr:hypothetical protein [Paenibacillus alba]MEC0227170.1 hypothetical protein [Paenibacillus alba]
MNEQEVEAKELFMLYRGHFIQMHKNGVLEAYKKGGIEREIEITWYHEIMDKLTSELSIRDWEAMTGLEALAKYYQDARMLEGVMTFVIRHMMGADSIVKLMYAERLLSILQSLKSVLPDDKRYLAYQQTLKILEDISLKPLIIDPGHELELFNLKDKKSLNNRVKKSMDEIKTIRFTKLFSKE